MEKPHFWTIMKWLFASVFGIFGLAAQVAASPFEDMARLDVLPGWRAQDGTHIAALQLTLAPGWKTYWRAPGDAGVPPAFSWRGSRNLETLSVTWPTPVVFDQNGMRSVGYEDTVVIPVAIKPTRQGKPVHLKGRVDIGICKDVCVPISLDLKAALPIGQAQPDPTIAAALAERPYSASEAGVERVECRLSPISDGVRLRAEISMPSAGGREFAVVEAADPQIWVAETQVTRSGGMLVLATEMMHISGAGFAVDRSGLRFTVLGRDYAVDIQGCNAS